MNPTNASPLTRAIAKRGRRWLDDNSEALPEALDPQAQTTTQMRAAVVEAMQQNLCDHYTRRPGIAPLCQAIAAGLMAHGVDVDPHDGVVITGGAEETRFVAVRTLAAGQTAFVPQSFAERYQIALEFAGAAVTVIDLTTSLPKATAGVLILPTFDPATGQPTKLAQVAHVETWVRDNELTVIADEIDTPLLSDSGNLQPFAARQDMAERTITLGGFAHVPALASWRVAWFAGPKPLVAQVGKLKQALTICSPAPGQYAALASLQKGT